MCLTQGLIDVVKYVFPNACRRYYCRHIYMSYKKEFLGLMLRYDLWNVAKSTHNYEFWMHMRNLEPKREQKPYDWLLIIPMSQWSRHAFWNEASVTTK